MEKAFIKQKPHIGAFSYLRLSSLLSVSAFAEVILNTNGINLRFSFTVNPVPFVMMFIAKPSNIKRFCVIIMMGVNFSQPQTSHACFINFPSRMALPTIMLAARLTVFFSSQFLVALACAIFPLSVFFFFGNPFASSCV